MDFLKESDFRKEIRSAPRRGYLFCGEEDYLKSYCVRLARETLCPDPTLAFFNEMRLDAMDFTLKKLEEALMPMPMMADRKLVTVTGLNFSVMKPNDLDGICEALGLLEQYDYNTVIFSVSADCLDPGTVKRPSATVVKLSEYLTPVLFEACPPAKLIAWVGKHFSAQGVNASPEVCSGIVEYCGCSMFVLANEIDKLCFYTLSQGRKEAAPGDIRKICVQNTEFGAFDFSNALMEGKTSLALDILGFFKFQRKDPLVILGEVNQILCNLLAVSALTQKGMTAEEISSTLKMHSFVVQKCQRALRAATPEKLRRALDLCAEADASLKQSAQGYTPIERLICSL